MVELASSGHTASPALVGGRHRSAKKLRLVKKKTVKAMLAKKGLKMRGGAEGMEGMEGGRKQRRKTHKRTRKHKGLFHF